MAPRKKPTKESVQKAAAKAERRSKTAPKADTVKAPGANDTEEQNRALFLFHLADTKNKNNITDLKKALNEANAKLRNAYKAAKADGFVKADFECAFEIQQADGEKKKKAAIARNLQIARWLGCDLGAQLDLFLQDERVPAVDRSYEEGKTDSLTGKSAKPDYDPSTPQHASYMQGYHDATESRIKSGITKLHPEVQKDQEQKAAKKAKREAEQAEDAKLFEEPPAPLVSGVAMTREEYKRQQAAQQGD